MDWKAFKQSLGRLIKHAALQTCWQILKKDRELLAKDKHKPDTRTDQSDESRL